MKLTSGLVLVWGVLFFAELCGFISTALMYSLAAGATVIVIVSLGLEGHSHSDTDYRLSTGRDMPKASLEAEVEDLGQQHVAGGL